MTYPERICVELGCRREVQRSQFSVYSRCPNHVRALVTSAFGASDSSLRARPEVPLSSPERVVGQGLLSVGSRSD